MSSLRGPAHKYNIRLFLPLFFLFFFSLVGQLEQQFPLFLHPARRSSGTISAGFQADCHPWPVQGAWQTRGERVRGEEGRGGEDEFRTPGIETQREKKKKKRGRSLLDSRTWLTGFLFFSPDFDPVGWCRCSFHFPASSLVESERFQNLRYRLLRLESLFR